MLPRSAGARPQQADSGVAKHSGRGHAPCRWEASNVAARLESPLLEPESIDVLYMDNTYCEPRQAQTLHIAQPPQECRLSDTGGTAVLHDRTACCSVSTAGMCLPAALVRGCRPCCRCSFPCRADAGRQVLDIVAQHPGHDIVIGVDSLGKGET